MPHLPSSFAYIDPASGSLILQMILAGIVGGLAFFRRAIFGFLGFFKSKKPAEKPLPEAAPKPRE